MFLRRPPKPQEQRQNALNLAVESALAVISFDLTGKILSANRCYCDIIGYSEQELVGQSLAIIMLPSYAKSVGTGQFWDDLRAGEVVHMAVTRVRKSGEMVWLESTYVPVRDAAGNVVEVFNFASDISDKTRERKHRESMMAALDRSQAVIEFDLHGNIVEMNDTFLAAMGYSREELIGKHHRMFMPPGAAEKADYKQFWDTLRTGEFVSGAFHRVAKGGREVFLRASYNPIKGLDGKVSGVVKFAQDVTEDFRLALDRAGQINALQRSQAVIEFDMHGNILTANENFLSVMGYTLDELHGKKHDVFIASGERESPAYNRFWDELRAGKAQVSEFRRISKTGQDVWIQASYNPILDAEGRPYKVVKFATNITAQKNAIFAFEKGVAALSAGELDHRLHSAMPPEFEALRNNFNEAMGQLSDLVGAILDSAESIRVETSHLSGASAELGRRTETQAASLEETAAALNELSASVESSATGARNAAGAVGKARSRSTEGRRVVDQTISAMGDIAQSSDQISRITSVIDDIAFQTNLLALNAGVEAARAGETGRGFAVVASEVRALAQRSSEAAREIAELIETSGRQVRQGVELVNESGQALSEIDVLVGEVDGLVHAIASSAVEQSTGLAEINSAVNQLDQVTQQNAAMFEESSAAVAVLSNQAGQLAAQASVFRIGNSGSATSELALRAAS
ncbi:methyl-accepting chemotaxis sensory transducer with Pas/Pac sensor [Rhodobacter aestuarii]|uniref:Methyl-accepting chemotaxis sensory transducer with Pas/Pac sensor n=1 Tax=Rhodobacter aestuarii TaxID=453582 RepID=A0A1N7J7Z1_9RHOB|nr:PAS domain-containing methyl-accepting chemotaxis protein [Rhodobacter aestuarii]PTV97082.1 methyl-accepting chemotaxis sensory transducer with Pas/Pac sensor [Rhodobacter aestuarii]SIS45488.1 methyl-accepting chemotaxis sensory transducer with Pas/Pac sensor [Rhodobacter aestuarii]